MNLRHSAGFALVVWYLIVRPPEARDVLTSSNCGAIDKSRKHETNDHIETSLQRAE